MRGMSTVPETPQSPQLDSGSSLALPEDLIAIDPEALKQLLLGALASDRDLSLSGKAVTRVGTAALQLLLAFRRQGAERDLELSLSEPSPALLDGIRCLGLETALGV